MALILPSSVTSGCDGFIRCWADWAYQVTDGFIWAGLLLGFLVVSFISTQRFGTARSFGFSSVVGIFGSVFLAVMGLMAWWVASLFILFGAVGFAVLIIQER